MNIQVFPGYSIAVGFIPFLLIAALYGYFLSMLSFLAVFLTIMVLKMEGAFYLSVYLAAILIYSLFAQYFWFKSKIKTVILTAVTAAVSAVMSIFCFAAVANSTYELRVFSNFFYYFIGASTATVVVSFALYLFFNYAPDSVKSIFPISYGYTDEYQNNSALRTYHKKTKLSIKITAIIVAVEIILGIAVAWFTVALFPDLKTMIIENRQHEMTFDETGKPTEKPDETFSDFEENIYRMDYRINRYALSFDIKMMLLILCVGVPLSAIANFYAKMRIGTPIGAMSAFLDYFMHSEDKDKLDAADRVNEISFNTNDEISVLEKNLKAALHEFVAYIRRMEEEQKLKNELEIARQASEAKSSFLSNMSHEIRTPINAVLGMNEMIIRESEDEQILEYANNARSAGNTLLSLVNDILDFSKIEAGKMEIICSQYHLGSTINDLVNMVSAKAADKGLELIINVNEHIPCMLIGDEVRIKQCLTNLLSNAVKYTDKGSVTLNIDYKRTGDEEISLDFEVKDTGIGIKQEDLSKLYSPFERIEEIRNRSIEGTGLGMSIVKTLLALMDTRLEVSSVYGEGTSFRFSVVQKVVSDEEIGDFKEKYREYVKSISKYHQRFQAPGANILVVDDTDMNLTVMKNLLKQTLVNIDTAESGFEALDKVKEKKYDVIFLDHRMPEMDGIQTLEAMRVMDGNLNVGVPVISLTANAVSGAREEYRMHGFTDYLAKPVSGYDLEKMLEHYLPPEKILSVSVANRDDEYVPDFDTGIPEGSFLHKLKGIDLDEGIKNCGGYEVLEKVVRDFLVSIDPKSDAIEEYMNEGDIRNYTVYVHALKSSSRLIGAAELSGLASKLEQAGNEENLSLIKEQTPVLLEKYRSYKYDLADALDSKEDLPEITLDELKDAFSGIRELVDAFDFKTADSIVEQLREYRIPESMKEKYDKLVHLLVNVDRDEILKLL
ncbi:MAG: response regulator [Lachnospiraceae bacterium]|nr:response regulator [Lachnospiraceae bacterium]